MIHPKPIFLFAFTFNRDFKQEQAQIRLNLVVALAAAQIAFLSGIDALEPKVRCHCLAVFDEKNKKRFFS